MLSLQSVESTTSLVPVSFLFRMYVACHVLRLASETRFTALVLLHRYGQAKQEATSSSSTEHHQEEWPWIGAMCLFLACKSEDEPRRLRDVINMVEMVLSPPESTNKGVGRFHTGNDGCDESVIVMDMVHMPSLDGAYWESKKKAIETEQMVLRWLGFDSFVSHPHRAVFWVIERLMNSHQSPGSSEATSGKKDQESFAKIPKKRKHDNTTESSKRDSYCDKNKNAFVESTNHSIRDRLLSLSSQRLNDALFYPQALQWGVIEMACASIDLAVVDAFEQVGGPCATESVTSKDGATKQDRENKLDAKANKVESIFVHGWWTQCDVSNKDFNDCRKCLMEATCYLKTMTPAEK